MTRAPGERWSHPMTVGVVAAVIGVAGAITAALISAGGGGGMRSKWGADVAQRVATMSGRARGRSGRPPDAELAPAPDASAT